MGRLAACSVTLLADVHKGVVHALVTQGHNPARQRITNRPRLSDLVDLTNMKGSTMDARRCDRGADVMLRRKPGVQGGECMEAVRVGRETCLEGSFCVGIVPDSTVGYGVELRPPARVDMIPLMMQRL